MALAVVGAVLVFVLYRLIRLEAEVRHLTDPAHKQTLNTRGTN